MGTMWKTALTFLSLASFLSTHAQDLSEASVVLLNEDKTPRCQITDNAFIEGLRECDEDDIVYAQMLTADSVEQAGVGGRIFMGFSALVLAAGNAALTCRVSLERDENNKREQAEGPGGAIARGLGAGVIQTLLGIAVMGKDMVLASSLWGLGLQIPASYGAYLLCNKVLDKMIDYSEEHGEPIEEEGDDTVLETIEEPGPAEAATPAS